MWKKKMEKGRTGDLLHLLGTHTSVTFNRSFSRSAGHAQNCHHGFSYLPDSANANSTTAALATAMPTSHIPATVSATYLWWGSRNLPLILVSKLVNSQTASIILPHRAILSGLYYNSSFRNGEECETALWYAQVLCCTAYRSLMDKMRKSLLIPHLGCLMWLGQPGALQCFSSWTLQPSKRCDIGTQATVQLPKPY